MAYVEFWPQTSCLCAGQVVCFVEDEFIRERDESLILRQFSRNGQSEISWEALGTSLALSIWSHE
ncbi:MAG: hypothetical protein NPIRA01_37250 [Nitrospirales bacterium]|nr:MAG: hypothetical protein NPIRA01_37250 [Nitrospirales bacterium]